MSGMLIRKAEADTNYVCCIQQPQSFEIKLAKQKKTSWLTYFVLCKEFYGVVCPRLQMAQVEVWSWEGDHPGGVTRALDHHRHVLILVLNRQKASISHSLLS